jgi:hypothetical protein
MASTNALRRTVNDKTAFIVLFIIIVALIIDTSIIKISRFIATSQFLLGLHIPMFILIAVIYSIGQYIVLEFVKGKNKEIGTTELHYLNVTNKVVSIVQYLLIAFIIFLILQMIVTSGYAISIVTAIVGISYTLAVFMTGLLAQRFFSWFKSNRNLVVLTYGLAIALLSINAGFTLVYVADVLMGQPPYLRENAAHTTAFFTSDPILNSGYILSSLISFILAWSATALLLRHYSGRLGRAKYWIILSIPLAYFLTQFQPLFLDIFSAYRQSDPVSFGIIYTLIFAASKPAGGILFAIAFLTVARSITHSSVRAYMIISAYGLMLLFTSNQAIVLVNSPYPPFGIATVSFMGLSSYLILVGIYSSAISIAHDVNLRQSIRKFAIKQSSLLDSIGVAQMEHDIQKEVITMTEKNKQRIAEETGVQSSLNEDDIKQYLNKVIEEVEARKKIEEK